MRKVHHADSALTGTGIATVETSSPTAIIPAGAPGQYLAFGPLGNLIPVTLPAGTLPAGAEGQVVSFDAEGQPITVNLPAGVLPPGAEGQIVGYDGQGNPIAIPLPTGGSGPALPTGTVGQVLGFGAGGALVAVTLEEPEAYDDTEIRDLIRDLGATIGYDDTAIVAQLGQQAQTLAAHDQAILDLQQAGGGSAYDDTAIQQSLQDVQQVQTAQAETLTQVSLALQELPDYTPYDDTPIVNRMTAAESALASTTQTLAALGNQVDGLDFITGITLAGNVLTFTFNNGSTNQITLANTGGVVTPPDPVDPDPVDPDPVDPDPVDPTPVVSLRAETVRNPSLAMSLGTLREEGPRPFVNHFKMTEPWRASNSGGGFTEHAALISAGHISATGEVIRVPAGIDNILTFALRNLRPNMGGGTRWRLMWDGTGTIQLSGASDIVRDVPNQIDFTAQANSASLVSIMVTAVTSGPLRNWRLVNHDDLAQYAAGEVFRDGFIEEIRNYRAIRFDNWVDIVENQTTTWASRATIADHSYMGNKRIPLELCIDLCNLIGADMWFCLPYRVTNDFIDQAAALTFQRLNAARHCYIEYAHKCWDFATPAAHYCATQGNAMFGGDGGENFMEWYGVQSLNVATRWRAVWGATNPRLHCVAQMFNDNPGLNNAALVAPRYVAMGGGRVSPHTMLDALGVHFQVDGGMAYGEKYSLIEGWRTSLSETEVFNRLRDQMLTGAWALDNDTPPKMPSRTVANQRTRLGVHKADADRYGLEMVCVDGGSHLHAGGAAMSNSAHTAMLGRYHWSSQFATVAQAIFAAWDHNNGGLFSWSVHSRIPEQNINVGLQRFEGDHNLIWDVVYGRNRDVAGPTGRDSLAFVGPFDTTDGATVPVPDQYPTLLDGMVRPDTLERTSADYRTGQLLLPYWQGGNGTLGNPDMVTFNADDSATLVANYIGTQWNSGMLQIIRPTSGMGRWAWVASSTAANSVLAMFTYADNGAELDFEYVARNGTFGFALNVHMPRTSGGSGAASDIPGNSPFVEYTKEQWKTPALFEIELDEVSARFFINGALIATILPSHMPSNTIWALDARMEQFCTVERHGSWAGWTEYLPSNMKIWGLRLPDPMAPRVFRQATITPASGPPGTVFTITPAKFGGSTPIARSGTLRQGLETVAVRTNGNSFTYTSTETMLDEPLTWEETGTHTTAGQGSSSASATVFGTGGASGPNPDSDLAAAVGADALQVMEASLLGLTPGQSVAVWGDASGNGRAMSQPTEASQPIYQTGDGLHWVRFDGVDDYMVRNESIIRSAVQGGNTVTIQMAIRAQTTVDDRLIAEGNSARSDELYSPIQSSSNDASNLGNFVRDSARVTHVYSFEGVVAFDGSARTIAVEDTGSALRTWVDGNLVREVAYPPSTITCDRTALAALVRNSISSFFAGDVFAYVIKRGPFSAELDGLLAAKAGINNAAEPMTFTFTQDGFIASE